MNRRGKIVLAAAAITVASLATFGAITASAHGWGQGDGQFASSLAAKLGISEDKVQEALTSMRVERKAQMLANFEDRLTTLVSEGKITEAQKQLILVKQKELAVERETNWEAWKDLTPDERRAKMDAHRESMEKWASDNGIDMQYLRPGFGKGHMKM